MWYGNVLRNPTIFNIIYWVAGTKDSSTKRLMFQVLFFFHNFLQNSLQKSFQVTFFSYKFTKIKINSFECPKSIRNYEKNIAWNIRRLVDESFVLTETIVLVFLVLVTNLCHSYCTTSPPITHAPVTVC